VVAELLLGMSGASALHSGYLDIGPVTLDNDSLQHWEKNKQLWYWFGF
jgi:hypothetical protein